MWDSVTFRCEAASPVRADSGSRPGLKPDTGKSGNALTAGWSRCNRFTLDSL